MEKCLFSRKRCKPETTGDGISASNSMQRILPFWQATTVYCAESPSQFPTGFYVIPIIRIIIQIIILQPE